MRTALCLLLMIAPVCARPPADGDARAFLSFMTKLAELRKAEADAEGNEIALPKAQKATADFLKALEGKEVVWPLLPKAVGKADKTGHCRVVARGLVPACDAAARNKGSMPAGWAGVAPALGKLKHGYASIHFSPRLPEAEAEGLRTDRLCFVRLTIRAVSVEHAGSPSLPILTVSVVASPAAVVK